MDRPDEMDTSAAAQAIAIGATFADLDKEIQHPDPAKRHLRVAQVRPLPKHYSSLTTESVPFVILDLCRA
jgi:hypothetical protein